MQSLGVPDWRTPRLELDTESVEKELVLQHDIALAEGELPPVAIYQLTTDCGGDIACTRRMIGTEIAGDLFTLFLGSDCSMHQYQIIVKDGIQVGDFCLKKLGFARNYYTSVSKIMNCWRESAVSIYNTWYDMWGPAEALAYAGKVPPRNISGRTVWDNVL